MSMRKRNAEYNAKNQDFYIPIENASSFWNFQYKLDYLDSQIV